MHDYPKRLIEVDLPIARISAHARREKSIRHGHIATLHIWWARRPLAACRAVICAALWPDPVDLTMWAERGDPRKDEVLAGGGAITVRLRRFLDEARRLMTLWAQERLSKVSQESYARLVAIQKDPRRLDDPEELRRVLLDFIADFANWDNSTDKDYLDTTRALTQAGHEALGGEPGTRPLIVDPFAGGGSIPLEALRVGADAFASDLNPVAVLLNKVVLEYIPKYGELLTDEVRKWGEWIKREAEKELAEFYPKDADGATPIAYLWARMIQCEGPGCGAEVPLLRTLWLANKGNRSVALQLIPHPKAKRVSFQIIVKQRDGWIDKTNPKTKIENPKFDGTVKRGSGTCPCCGYTTPVSRVRTQIKSRRGGANDARLFAVVIARSGEDNRDYRLPTELDLTASRAAAGELERRKPKLDQRLSLVPDEPTPQGGGRGAGRAFSQRIYGMDTFGDLFTARQLLTLSTLARLVREAGRSAEKEIGKELATAVTAVLGLCCSKLSDLLNSLCSWQPSNDRATHLFARQAIQMTWDFAESAGASDAVGNFGVSIANIARILDREAGKFHGGHVERASATQHPLPDDAADALVTDPPYYDAVPYSDLSDFFYVWMRRALSEVSLLPTDPITPKEGECIVDEVKGQDPAYFERTMSQALAEGRRVVKPSGVAVIVFAHKSTAGWETQLQALITAGWILTGSWPIDTEWATRLRAVNSAALASSVHLVCRPREKSDGSVRPDKIGDWRDVLQELPRRIHEWMPRLAQEGIIGADAIFACLGPALEIFSRYSRVEKASGEAVTLREYLEHVWAAVSNEALSMIFKDADAASLEPDARLTAMWLWTLGAGRPGGAPNGNGQDAENEDGDDEEIEASAGKLARDSGFTLEFDAARKIAQGLGVHLEKSQTIVEVKGDKARLLPVSERTRYLFGKGAAADEAGASGGRGRGRQKKPQQQSLFIALETADAAAEGGALGLGADQGPPPGATVLDRIHQAMLLFAAGRGEALKHFLVEDGIGQEARFWKLAQSLSALYPPGTDEKRWVDGVLARKKGLGL